MSENDGIVIVDSLREAIDAKCGHCIKLNREVMNQRSICPECGGLGSSKFCPNDGQEMGEPDNVCPAEPGKCPLQDVSAYYKASE